MTTTNDVPNIEAHEEIYDRRFRQQRGFRPVHYVENTQHPDQRPCPPWCWVGRAGGEYEHEFEAAHPLTACHRMEVTPAVAAELYQGRYSTAQDNIVSAATIEPRLEQVGQGQPTILVHLRHWEGREPRFDEVLRLTIDDARELMTALGYLVETAAES